MNSIYAFPSREAAEAAAATLTDLRRGDYALGWHGEPADTSRIVARYIVNPFRVVGTTPVEFGVVERWRYADCPERGEFGGGFITLATIRALGVTTAGCPSSWSSPFA